MHRSQVDDAAAALAVHIPDRGTSGQKCTVEVNGEHALPISKLELFERRNHLIAGVADQDVDTAECPDHSSHRGIDLFFTAYIDPQCDRCRPVLYEFPSRLIGADSIQIDHRQFGPGASESARDLATNAACRAGHDGHLVFEAHLHGSIATMTSNESVDRPHAFRFAEQRRVPPVRYFD